MNPYYDRAVDELEEDLAEGRISRNEFQKEMRALLAEMQEEAAQAAQDVYDNMMGGRQR